MPKNPLNSPTSTLPTKSPLLPRHVLPLAGSTFITLIAEPAFLLFDSALIGHLGTSALASFSVAASILSTAVGLFIFLAYGSTAAISWQLGAGSPRSAQEIARSSLWLAALLGLPLAAGVALLAAPLVGLFGSAAAAEPAIAYLRYGALGLPCALLSLAATGILRAVDDARSIVLCTTLGFSLNAGLNALFVYSLDFGLTGSALGTALAQFFLAVALLSRTRRQLPARIRGWPHWHHVASVARSGLPLLIRTIALRAVLLITLWCADSSATNLASYQISLSIWIFCCFALDAIAIAGQPFIGKGLGSGQRELVRHLAQQLSRWALFFAGILAIALGLLHQVLPRAFSPDALVREGVAQSLLVLALLLPWAGIVFVLDGVLIGAGDGLWLAKAATAQLIIYLAFVALLRPLAPSPPQIWLIFAIFMFIRGLMLIFRARGDAWLNSAQKIPSAAEVQRNGGPQQPKVQ